MGAIFFLFLFILCTFHILLHFLHFPVPLYPHSALATNPSNYNKIKFKRTNIKNKKGNISFILETVVWHNESCRKHSYPFTFTCKCSLKRLSGLVLVLWNSSLNYPAVTLSCGNHEALGLMFPSPAPANHSLGGCWGKPPHNPGLV